MAIRHVDVKPGAVKEIVASFAVIAGVACMVPSDEFSVLLCLHLCVTMFDMLADVV